MVAQTRCSAQPDGAVPPGPRRAVAVGLTGGIGAGKSTALAMFRELGALTTSADAIVHDLYTRPGFIARLHEHFGPDVLNPDGTVDRRRLAALVRGKREKLRWLEELTHPLVAEEIERFVADAPAGSVVVCEVPLLVESGYEPLFDLIVTVEAARGHRLRRSASRFHPQSFDEFERLQATTDQRVAVSDLVFRNDGDVDAMRDFVRTAYERALALLAGPSDEAP